MRLNFDPVLGHEQRGARPALVISPQIFNKKTGMTIVCPITSRIKNYSFEVPVEGGKIGGVILVDHLKSIDWKVRRAKKVDQISEDNLNKVIRKLKLILF